jgi:hypothetical protein
VCCGACSLCHQRTPDKTQPTSGYACRWSTGGNMRPLLVLVALAVVGCSSAHPSPPQAAAVQPAASSTSSTIRVLPKPSKVVKHVVTTSTTARTASTTLAPRVVTVPATVASTPPPTTPVTAAPAPPPTVAAPPTTIFDPSIFITADPACPDNGDGTATWSIAFRDHFGMYVTASRTQKIGTTVTQPTIRLTQMTVKYAIQVLKSPGYTPPGRTDVNCQVVNVQRCTFAGVCIAD